MKHNIIVSLQNVKSNIRPIRIRVTFGGRRMDCNSGMSYDADKWRDGKARPNTKNTNRQSAAEINGRVARIVDSIEKYFQECELRDAVPSDADIREIISGRRTTATLDDAWQEYATHCRVMKNYTENTLKNHRCTFVSLFKFDPGVTMKSITLDWCVRYMDWYRTRSKYRTYIQRCDKLRSFLTFLNGKKYTNINIEELQVRYMTVDNEAVIYLTPEELSLMREYKTDNPMHDVVRDMYVFSCYSSLRYSDLQNLKKSDIKGGQIMLKTIKTNKLVYIETNKYTRALIDKYSYVPGEYVFPRIPYRTAERHIKTIAKKCGISSDITITSLANGVRYDEVFKKYEVITMHSARRTFVIECLTRGIPAHVVMRWTGHRSITALQPYIAVLEAQKQEEMKKFDN